MVEDGNGGYGALKNKARCLDSTPKPVGSTQQFKKGIGMIRSLEKLEIEHQYGKQLRE